MSEGSDDGRTGVASQAITAQDSEGEALRAWLRSEESWPAWSLYNWGTAVQVKDGKRRYDQIILAVPAGAPVQQWLQIHSVDLEDDAERYFDNLVREGRLSCAAAPRWPAPSRKSAFRAELERSSASVPGFSR